MIERMNYTAMAALVQAFFQDLDQEREGGSDRGLAVTALSGIDEFLVHLLSASMVERPKQDLFTGTSPLATLSSKIALSQAMGLISDDEYQELNMLRKVRNAFAHQLGVTFRDETICNLCRELKLSQRIYAPRGLPQTLGTDEVVSLALPSATPEYSRSRFAEAAMVMVRVLFARTLQAGDHSAKPSEFEYAEDADAIVTELGYLHLMQLGKPILEAPSKMAKILSAAPVTISVSQLDEARANMAAAQVKADQFLTDVELQYSWNKKRVDIVRRSRLATDNSG